ncbi:MAG: hypothetical protein ACE5D8_01250 [Fidelibacterota bacterium]
MKFPSSLGLFTGLLAYTEIHYRFPWFPISRYYQREPEIIVDVPYRVDPGKPIPIFLLIKDAHIFPIALETFQIMIECPSGRIETIEKRYNEVISTRWYWGATEFQPSESGVHRITGTVSFRRGNTTRTVVNHNVKTSPGTALSTWVDDSPLPGSAVFCWGDLHYHSSYTEDYVEFGAPLPMTVKAAAACGLDFLAVTDHSYDLDDKPGSWSETDPDLRKWKRSRFEIQSLNESGSFRLIPAEEVTVRNGRGKNIHFLIYRYADFIPGSGDGAEDWFKTRSEYDIADIIAKTGDSILKIAAHPRVSVSWLEKLLINRGYWEDADLNHDGLDGLQILNGSIDRHFESGLSCWRRQLLNGKKRFIYAGNDAHGNFNLFHQIRIPMLTTAMHREQILGQCRNGVPRESSHSLTELLIHLKQGRSIITNGPALQLTVNERYFTGESIVTDKADVALWGESSPLFGNIAHVRLFRGDLNRQEEKMIKEWGTDALQMKAGIIIDINGPIYLRAEIWTVNGQAGFTNPLWISQK